MGELDLTFRPAGAGDADTIAPLVYESGPPGFSYVFTHGTRVSAIEFLRASLKTGPGEFGFATHYVAETEGRTVAVGSGYSGRTARKFMLPALRNILGSYGPLEALGIIQRGIKIERAFPTPRNHEYMISHLSVVADMRSRGVGAAMIHYLLGRAREEGCTHAVLDVVVGNPRAEALYERLGFCVTRETPSHLSNATATVPGVRRMEYVLSGP